MNNFEAFIIGLVQGLTEFLPVSSSGHIAVLQKWFGITSDNVSITIVAHVGTLLAILFYFRREFKIMFRDLFNSNKPFIHNPTIRLVALVFVASIPAAIVGICFREFFDQFYKSTTALGVFFLITVVILFLSRIKTNNSRMGLSPRTDVTLSYQINFLQAFLIGLSQAFAIFPGISRSGTTITTALFVGLSRKNAAFFSFLISIPAILGATYLDLKHITEMENVSVIVVLLLSSLFFGFIGLWGVVHIVNKGKLHYFCFYLLPLAIYLLFFIKP